MPLKKMPLQVVVLLVILVAAMLLHMTSGSYYISVVDVVKTLFAQSANAQFELVIFDMRLPRLLTAICVGIGLAIAGVVLQQITKNPLADPGILGINAGAGCAVVLFMYFFKVPLASANISSVTKILFVPLFGFVGGALAAAIILAFAYKHGRMDMQRMILTGIAINAGFGALTLLWSLKMNPDDYESAAIWLNGSIFNSNWYFVISMVPWIVVLGMYVYRKANLLDYFQLEDEQVVSLGIALEREKIWLLLASVGVVSACVSVSGSIGFIGLMAPHIARQLVGVQTKYVMPVSALIGAALVVTADYIAKTVFAPVELAVGVVVSLIGIPYFLYLLVKAKG